MSRRVSLELQRGGGAARPGQVPRTPSSRPMPNGAATLPTLSDDRAARRRELLVVIALCEARTKGAREREAPEHTLALVRDGSSAIGTLSARLGRRPAARPRHV